MAARIRPRLTEHVMLCRACDTYFRGERNFDKHRIGEFGVDRRCADPADVELTYRPDKGYWGGPPMTDEERGRAKAGWAGGETTPKSVEPLDSPGL